MNFIKSQISFKITLPILVAVLLGYIFFASTIAAEEKTMSEKEVIDLLKRTDLNASPEIYEAYIILKNYKPNRKPVESKAHFYRKGDKMLAIYLTPAIQKGQAYIRNGDDMWMFLPNSKKITKIGAKDQSMGGEASNTDILRVDLVYDYNGTYLGEEELEGVLCYKLELIAKKRTIAYDKVIYWISVEKELPVKREYFALSGKKLKIMYFKDVVMIGGDERPSFVLIENAQNNQYKTEMIYTEMTVDVEINDNIFTPTYIKRKQVF